MRRGHWSSMSRGKSRPRSTGVTSRGGYATPPSPPPAPTPDPVPVPLPVPPVPVPGPRTSAAPCVGAVPWRGVSVTAILGGCGISICGLGATTGVAWLRMFAGDPPAFSSGLGRSRCCCAGGGGGGGGGTWPTSNTCKPRCTSATSIFPDICNKANRRTAWIATTPAIAPPLSRALRFDRYILTVNALNRAALRT